jgi:hypothetical protein
MVEIEWHASTGLKPRFDVPRYGMDIRRTEAPIPLAGRLGDHPLLGVGLRAWPADTRARLRPPPYPAGRQPVTLSIRERGVHTGLL